MKKGIISLAIMLTTIALLMTTASAAFTVSTSMKSDSSTIKVGDTVTLTIGVNEKVVASNFDISYDSTILKLEGSGTSNLSVAEKDGKIACIYADMSGTGTNEFKVKFKALKETTGTNLKIENAKFRAEGQDESYTGEQISGLGNAITVKVVATEEKTPSTGSQSTGQDKTTTKTTNLPKTGKETGVVIAGIAVLVVVAIVFGKKSKELSKIFSSLSVFVIALVMVTSLNKNVYAVPEATATNKIATPTNTEQPEQFGSGVLSNGEKYVGILVNKSDSDRKIKVVDLTEPAQGIIQVFNDKKEPTSNDGQDVVKTGYYLTKETGEYKIVLYGDANGDGIVCDADDIMVIIKDYLGQKGATELEKLAANLDARDDVLDSDDLMQMINMYLGKIEDRLVKTKKPSDSDGVTVPTTENNKEYLDKNWEYSTESNNIILKKYIGQDVDVKIKEYYNIDGTQYKTRMGETTTYNPVFGTEAYGPFVDNKLINTVTFESTNILQGDISCLFYQCTNLKSVIGFGGNITNMYSTFTRCTSLLNEKNKNSSDYVEGAEIDIPDSVENLDYAFMECSSMNYIPNINSSSKLKTAKSAFEGCNKVHSGTVYLNSTVTDISRMFYGCKFLGYYGGEGFYIYSNINIDNIATSLAFSNCGYETPGSSGYGSQPHEIIVLNATSTSDRNYQFFVELLQDSEYCTLNLKLSE